MSNKKKNASQVLETDTGSRMSSHLLLALLTFINILNFVDRQLIASFANDIKPDLDLSNFQFSLLTGFSFILFYSIMGLFMGTLADRLHRPRLLAFGLGLWRLLTAFSGMARSFTAMLIPRMLIGVGESVATPTSLSLLSDRYNKAELGLVSAIYYLGVPLGIAASLLIAGYIGPLIGWRTCFMLIGGVGVVIALFLLFLPETPRMGLSSSSQNIEKMPFKEIISNILKLIRQYSSLRYVIIAGVMFHVMLGAAAFEQLWLVQERGFEKSDILVKSGWIAVFAGILGNLSGGILGDIWQRKTNSGRPMFLFWAFLILLPIGLIYRLSDPDAPIFWVGMFFAYFQLGLVYGPSFSTVQELSPPRYKATLIAFYILTMNLVGLGVGGTLSGILADFLFNNNVEEPYTITLIVFSVMAASGIPLLYLSGKRFFVDRVGLLNSLDK